MVSFHQANWVWTVSSVTLGNHTDDSRTVMILRASGPVFKHGVLKQVGQSLTMSELGGDKAHIRNAHTLHKNVTTRLQ